MTLDPTVVSLGQLLGPWRPKSLPVDDATAEIVRRACLDAADKRLSFGLTDQPVALAEARGLGLVSVVLADEHAAFECRAQLAPDGATATAIEPPSGLDPASTEPREEDIISVVRLTRINDPTGSRMILIGRVGPKAFSASVVFNDESEVVAAKGNGWYLAWWPGSVDPGSIVSADMRNVVLDGAEDPTRLIEGRVAPGTWWIDPAAGRIAPTATS